MTFGLQTKSPEIFKVKKKKKIQVHKLIKSYKVSHSFETGSERKGEHFLCHTYHITMQTAFVGFCGCLRNHHFMSISSNFEHMGNSNAIILQESNKYSVAFYRKSVVVLWFQKLNFGFFLYKRFQITFCEQEIHRNKSSASYTGSGLVPIKSENMECETNEEKHITSATPFLGSLPVMLAHS